MKKKFRSGKFSILLMLLFLIYSTAFLYVIKISSAEKGGFGVPQEVRTQTEKAEILAVPEPEFIFAITKNGSTFYATCTYGGLENFSYDGFVTVIDQAAKAAKALKLNPIIEFDFPTGMALDIGTDYAIFDDGTYIVSGNITGSGDFVIYIFKNADFYMTSGSIINTSSGNAIRSGTTSAVNCSVLITGGTVSSNTGPAITNYANGTITISGGTVSSNTHIAVGNSSNLGIVNVSGTALITSATTANGTINNSNNGTIAISNGTVENTSSGNAIFNANDGIISISGGKVENTSSGNVIRNNGAGTVAILGGTISADTGPAVYNNSIGLISISGTDTLVTSAASNSTIYLLSGTAGVEILKIEGGTVRNTADGIAVYNTATGTVNISGGTVQANTGKAINNNITGLIFISGNSTLITSACTGSYSGTIYLADISSISTILTILGGTIENTGSGDAIYNYGKSKIEISDGTVQADTGKAIYSIAGLISISGTNTLITSANADWGTIHFRNDTALSTIFTMSDGVVQNTASGAAIRNDSAHKIEITGGTVSGNDGVAILNMGTGQINISGNSTIITSSSISFSNGAIYLTSGAADYDILTISGGTIQNTSSGNAIYNGSAGTIEIAGGIIKNTDYGNAIRNNGAGVVKITGGTVSANTGISIYNFNTGKIDISGNTTIIASANTNTPGGTIFLASGSASSTILTLSGGIIQNTASGTAVYNNNAGIIQITSGIISANNNAIYSVSGNITMSGSPQINGIIYTAADKLETLSGFIPIAGIYTVHIENGQKGGIAVLNGANHINYFNSGPSMPFSLSAQGQNIVLSDKINGSASVELDDWIYGLPNEPVPVVNTGDYTNITYLYTGRGGTVYNSDVKPVNAGNYTVTATFHETAGYATAIASADFMIFKKEIQITIDNAEKFYGNSDPIFSYTAAEGALIGSDTLGITKYIREDGNDAGAYSIYDIIFSNNNYSVTVIPGTLIIKKANQAPLNIISSNEHTFGTDYIIVTSGGTLSGAVRFEILGGTAIGQITGNTLKIYSPGIFVLRAVIEGNNNYETVYSGYFILNIKLQSYTILFIDYDGKLLWLKEADYGTSIATLLPQEPIRTGYEFVRWEGYIAGMTVTRDAAFIAVYLPLIVQKYTVVFYDENGSVVIKSVQAEEGTDISTLFPVPPVKIGYEFSRWDGYTAGMTVTKNLSFKAVYTEINEEKYIVTFLDEDGTVIKVYTNVIKGADILILMPSNPIKPPTAQYTYSFSGWNGYNPGDTVNSDLTFTATYAATLNTYTVIFKDYNKNALGIYMLGYGETIIPPQSPIRDGYEFIRWEGYITGATVTGDAEFTAVYSPIPVEEYTVTFYDEDGITVIKSALAFKGADISALLPAPPQKSGYVFARWDGYIAGMTVTGNLNFKAVYTSVNEERYTVTFLDGDGTIIRTVTDVIKGTDISTLFPTNPIKAPTVQYIYTFAGWDGYTLGNTVESDLVFTAVYNEILNTYIIIFKDMDTNIIAFYTQGYGETIIPPQAPIKDGYEFVRWNGYIDGMTVTGDAVFTAVYSFEPVQQHTITFYDEDGETIILQVQAFEGASVSALLPNPPYKEGYTFTRWNGYTAGMTVTGNLSFTAVYAPVGEETYTVTFLDDDGTVIKTVTDVVKGTDISTLLPLDPVKAPTAQFTYTFRGWYGFTVGNILDGNLTLIASYTSVIKTYTITFYDEGGKLLTRFGAEYGTLISTLLIQPPVKEGFEFVRWQGYTAGMVLTSNAEFTAVYIEKGSQYYNVTFYDEDGETVISQTETALGADISTLLPEPPSKEGYVFARWDGYLAGMTVNGNMEFTAVYTSTDEQRYTVIFLDDDKTLIKVIFDAVKGADISSLFPSAPYKNPTAEYTYEFSGWFEYYDYDFVNENLIFIATYIEIPNTYIVTFIDWDGNIIHTETLIYGSVITLPTQPVRDGYEFVRWQNYIAEMSVTQDITFTAIYSKTPTQKYTVTFYDEDGLTVLFSTETVEGADISLLLPNFPSKPGYVFARWDGYCKGMLVTGNHTFTAVYTFEGDPKFTVMLIDDEGNLIKVITNVIKGADISVLLPADNPAKPANAQYTYIFNGWYGFEYGDCIENDLTLVAKYIKVLNVYTIIFYDGDGTQIKIITDAAYGTPVLELLPADPQMPSTGKYSYIFEGWQGYIEGMMVAGNISFNAIYKKELNSYTVKFLDWDGLVLYQITVFYGESVTYDITPSRTGYTFTGWDNIAENITEDITITAIYSPNEYTITIDTGEEEYEITFKYGTELEMPEDPVKEGYTFEGWYLDKECTVKYNLDSMPAENITLYAKWTEEPVKKFPYKIFIPIAAAIILVIILTLIFANKKKNDDNNKKLQKRKTTNNAGNKRK